MKPACATLSIPMTSIFSEKATTTLPFRNTDKRLGNFMLAPGVVSMFDAVADAEAAVRALDAAGLGDNVVYGRGETARRGVAARNRGWLARSYRALQAVMSDEFPIIKHYEQKIAEGSSFVLVPLSNPDDAGRVAAILRAHGVNLARVLGGASFRSL